MYCLNIKVELIDFDKIDINKKMVYVCNHTSHHDSFLINRFIKSKVLASDAILHTFIGRFMSEFTKPFIIKRGQVSNTSNIIKEHIDKTGSIVIFPQALLANNRTITKFRTGAFVLGLPVQPILFEYTEDQSSMSILPDMFCFPELHVKIRALNLITNNKNLSPIEFAETVRHVMANKGNFMLSNVDSHDVKD
jgi:1-acyl-sn-glycerol-3-phosphate acyltransferase